MMLDGVVRALSSVRARIGIADVFVGYSYAAATASDGVRRCLGLAATPRAGISCRDERWSFPRIGRDAGARRVALIGNMSPVASRLSEEFELTTFERDRPYPEPQR
jgi:uncharacterized protein (DUF4213/DUF364 family)